MCCGPLWSRAENEELCVGECPECGADVDADGESVDLMDCAHSPVECDLCGWCPCDLSC